MILSNVVRYDSVNSIWISDYNTSGRLFDLRCKSLETGIIKRGFERPVHSDMGDYLRLSNDDFRTGEPVAYQIESISTKDLEEWFASDESVPLLDFLARKHSDDAPEADNAPADDQDHEQDQQDHEPDPEPDVTQNEPDPESDLAISWLTELQRSVMRCLSYESGSVADIAEKMGRTTNSDKAQIRKTVHELCDMGLVLKVGTVVQNGRPAQIWGVR